MDNFNDFLLRVSIVVLNISVKKISVIRPLAFIHASDDKSYAWGICWDPTSIRDMSKLVLIT